MADKNGIVSASGSGLARRAGMIHLGEWNELLDDALDTLEGPDHDSRSADFEGRRIERIDGGWRILNYGKYRELMADADRKAAAADRQARYAARKRQEASAPRQPPVSVESAHVRSDANDPIAEAEVEVEAEVKQISSPVTETKIAAEAVCRARAHEGAPPAPAAAAAAAGLDDDIEKIARAIAAEPMFAGINALDMATRTMPVGNRKPTPWYLQAIADAAADTVQGETMQAKQSRLRRYLQSCKAPRVATANALCLTPEQQAQWDDEKRRLRDFGGGRG